MNCAIALERPLLIKGEPGTGKTLLAQHVAEGLGLPIERWHVKSTTKAAGRPLRLRHRAAPQRLRASATATSRTSAPTSSSGPLGAAFAAEQRHVLLIDEVDKADLEFPNDLLHELDEMRFTISETSDEVVAKQRPVVIITSNNEKELPDAFLRRCVFHFIEFPDRELMKRIVAVHHPHLEAAAARSGADQVLLAARAERAAQAAVDLGADRLDRGAASARA